MKVKGLLLIGCALLIGSCSQYNKFRQDEKDRMEMRKNYNNFLTSIQELDPQGLDLYTSFPDEVQDKRAHVKKLLVDHLDRIKTGPAVFDETGVVLTRFLGLAFHKYVIKEMDIDREAGRAKIRISVAIGYENNIRASQSEPGTTYFIPTKPWGHMNKVILGEINKVPRWDLSYIEYDVYLSATEHEGYWQIMRSVVDESTIQYRKSEETFYENF